MRHFVMAALVFLGTLGMALADWPECREAMIDKRWDAAFEACHVEAVKAEKGEGDKRATLALARLYYHGRGTGRDYREALRWYRIAADKGSPAAMSMIGYMYSNGRGVSEDKKAGLKWYRKSAELGDYRGQYNVGINLVGRVARGQGKREDLVTGYMYLLLSEQTGRGSVRFREEYVGYWKGLAENELTWGQIDEAKRRARAWRKECAKDRDCKRRQRIK